MNKNRGKKVVIIIAFSCILLGAVLVGAGFAQGGNLRYLSINSETVSWWPFKHSSLGIGFDFDDTSGSDYEERLGTIHSIQIDSDASDIIIRRGSENKVSYRAHKKKYVTCRNDNGVLTIKVDHNNVLHNVSTKVIVELKDDQLDKLFIDNDLGDLDIKDIHAKNMDIRMSLGDIEVKNVMTEKLSIDQKCGDIEVEGRLLNQTNITNKLGETDVKINGNRNEYRYEINNSLGDTEVLGSDHEFSADIEGGNNNAKHFVSIDNKLGDIEFDIR